MSLLNKSDCSPIVVEGNQKIKYFAFDGCYYYFTVCNKCQILKYNLKLNFKKCFDVYREYKNICYDFKENCFWVSAENCHNKIFKLDCDMNEIDSISISCHQKLGCEITGISFNCYTNKIVVSFPFGFLEIDKNSSICTPIYCNHNIFITSVLSISPGYLITAFSNNNQCIYTLNEYGEIVESNETPCNMTIKNMIFNPCLNHGDFLGEVDYLICKNGCYFFICKNSVEYCDLGFELCPCNLEICKDCHPNKPDVPCGDPCADIIESVALMEASLAHILNAEGEKLQKVLATTDDIDKILCVNKEVNKVVINATHLEHVLHAKLQSIDELCCCKDICTKKITSIS